MGKCTSHSNLKQNRRSAQNNKHRIYVENPLNLEGKKPRGQQISLYSKKDTNVLLNLKPKGEVYIQEEKTDKWKPENEKSKEIPL